jgi:hypothetical protein
MKPRRKSFQPKTRRVAEQIALCVSAIIRHCGKNFYIVMCFFILDKNQRWNKKI